MERGIFIILPVLSYHKFHSFINALFNNQCYFVIYYFQAQFEITPLLQLSTVSRMSLKVGPYSLDLFPSFSKQTAVIHFILWFHSFYPHFTSLYFCPVTFFLSLFPFSVPFIISSTFICPFFVSSL